MNLPDLKNIDPNRVSEAIERAKALKTPDRLMGWLYEHWKRPRHIQFMGDVLSKVLEGDKRIILECSVRHAKSWTASHALPVWYLTHHPEHLIGMATYQANFSALWGRRVRSTIKEHGERLGVQLSSEAGAAASWETTRGGGMHTAGVGGELTGRGFHLMIMDDPIKNAEEANSQLQRDNLWEWYTTTFYTRLEPGGSVVVIMARWHGDDLTGRLIEEMKDGGDQWEIIRMPAIAEEDDILGRNPGEALWPERYDEERLGQFKRAVGKRAWLSLYQQRPTIDDGDRYRREWFRYAERMKDGWVLKNGEETRRIYDADVTRYGVADLAQTARNESDYTARAAFAVTREHDIIIFDVWHAQAESPVVKRVLRGDFQRFDLLQMGIEDAHWGKTLIQEFRAEGLPVLPMRPGTKDKVARSSVAEPMVEAGKVFFDKDIQDLDGFEMELLQFPNGAHDDRVDMLAYAAIMVSNMQQPGVVFDGLKYSLEEDGGHLVDDPEPFADPERAGYVFVQPGATNGALLVTVREDGCLLIAGEVYSHHAEARSLAADLTALMVANGVDRHTRLRGSYLDPDAVFLRQKEVGSTGIELAKHGWNLAPWMGQGEATSHSKINTLIRDNKLRIHRSCRGLLEEMRHYRQKMDRDKMPIDGQYIGQNYLIRPLCAAVGLGLSYGGGSQPKRRTRKRRRL